MFSAKFKEHVKIKIPFTKSGSGNLDVSTKKKLSEVSQNNSDVFLSILSSNIEGISEEQVGERQKEFGLNEIHHEKAPSWFAQLLHSFIFPFNAVLMIIAIITYLTDVLFSNAEEKDYKTIILLSVMILLSSLIRFWQEFKSNKAAETLKGMIKTTANVLRKETGRQEINIRDLVPGDIIYLSVSLCLPVSLCRLKKEVQKNQMRAKNRHLNWIIFVSWALMLQAVPQWLLQWLQVIKHISVH